MVVVPKGAGLVVPKGAGVPPEVGVPNTLVEPGALPKMEPAPEGAGGSGLLGRAGGWQVAAWQRAKRGDGSWQLGSGQSGRHAVGTQGFTGVG